MDGADNRTREMKRATRSFLYAALFSLSRSLLGAVFCFGWALVGGGGGNVCARQTESLLRDGWLCMFTARTTTH